MWPWKLILGSRDLWKESRNTPNSIPFHSFRWMEPSRKGSGGEHGRGGGGIGKSLQGYGKGVVQGRVLDRLAHGGGVLGGGEGDRGAARPGGVFRRRVTVASLLADEMLGVETHCPAGKEAGRGGARAGCDDAAGTREAEEAHAGGVFAIDELGVPSVPAVIQQDGGIVDAGAVVGDRDDVVVAAVGGAALNGDVDGGGAGAAGVLERFAENVGDPGREHSRYARERAVVDAGADLRGAEVVSCMGRPCRGVKGVRPARRVPGGARVRVGGVVRLCGGTRGGPRRGHGR